jgi:hypothetical protein
MRKTLSFVQIEVATAQITLCCAKVLDINARAVPSDDFAPSVANRYCAVQQCAVFPISAQNAALSLKRPTTRNCQTPFVEECDSVVGMESFGPFPSTHLFEGQTEVLQPSPISKVDVSVRSGAMQQCRSAIRQCPEWIYIDSVSFVIAGQRYSA